MTITELTFTLPAHAQGETEEVTLWVPPYVPTFNDDGVEVKRWAEGSVTEWTRYDQYAWPIEPGPSNLVRELSAVVGYLNKGAPISYHCAPYSECGMKFPSPDPDYLLHLEAKEVAEYCEAYDQWIDSGRGWAVDIYQSSLFTEWNQSLGETIWVGSENIPGKIPEFTPEMLVQREQLNWAYNISWNQHNWHGGWIGGPVGYQAIPPQTECLVLVSVGENYGVAQSPFGAVYVPRGCLNYLQGEGECFPGLTFTANIQFLPEVGEQRTRFPWRIQQYGIISYNGTL